MAKATLSLPMGGTVTIDGSATEIQQFLDKYGAGATSASHATRTQTKTVTQIEVDDKIDLNEVVNLIKSCDEAEAIEKHVLDAVSVVNRTLLPLYIVHEHMDMKAGLSSGDIEAVTRDLGVRVKASNASTSLAKEASKYVDGDKVRRKGRAVRYRLNRRGVKYFQDLLSPPPKKG